MRAGIPWARSQDAAREWYQDARFGMMIHWGLYSLLGRKEWVQEYEKIKVRDYEKLAVKFRAPLFDAREWVSLARAAGMKYITFTTRHHDGFALFHTKANDWSIERTPFGRDAVGELAEECRRQGLGIFFYYSHLDWHHTDYFPRGRTGHRLGRPHSGNWNRYLDYMNTQLEELCSNYGPISGFWFDGMWDRKNADWKLDRSYGIIRHRQPHALIINNHRVRPHPEEGVQVWERDLPGHYTSGFTKGVSLVEMPLETCDTLNKSWGYDCRDRRFKTRVEVVRYLVRACGYGANFLLNVGPRGDGTFQPQVVERLQEVGEWMRQYGDSVYGTRPGPVAPGKWGVSVRKGKSVYLHLFDCQLAEGRRAESHVVLKGDRWKG